MFLKILPTARLRRSLRHVLEAPGFEFVRTYYAGVGSCLLYHRVRPSGQAPAEFSPYAGLTVSAERFAIQMGYLRDNFPVLALPEFIERLQRGTVPRGAVTVTFDDGYRDNLEVALPILERFQIPATVFVTTRFIGCGRGLWWYDLEKMLRHLERIDAVWRGHKFSYLLRSLEEKTIAANALNDILKSLDPPSQQAVLRLTGGVAYAEDCHRDAMLDWSELQRFAQHPLITIGAHTVTHPVLSSLSSLELEFELRQSRRELSERLGRPIALCAYPYGGIGQASRREFRAAEHAGYTASFTTRFGHVQHEHRSDLHAIPRLSIVDTDDLAAFARKLSGLTAFVAQRGRRFVTA
jgi:peptidoglycan/xylan/chitin deacetylase (PgdA/CDA1 family)